jgi:hypothetical protein
MNKNTILASIVFTLIAVTVFFVSRRGREMEHLYLVATDPRTFDYGKCQAATKKLAEFPDKRATEYLLEIATNSATSEILGTQKIAISKLATRNDPVIADRLSNQLQLSESLNIRLEVSKALTELPCESECIRSILYYQERRWHGEPTIQERLMVDANFAEQSNKQVERAEQEVSQSLNSVLVKEQPVTISVLVNIYGLGSLNPSLFALKTLQELGLQQSCPLLIRSFSEMKKLSEVGYKGPLPETHSAIEALKCPTS